jgi:hypothetical protein
MRKSVHLFSHSHVYYTVIHLTFNLGFLSFYRSSINMCYICSLYRLRFSNGQELSESRKVQLVEVERSKFQFLSVKSKFSPNNPDQHWDPPSLLFGRYWPVLFQEKHPRCGVGHWPPSSARIKNEWSYTSSPSTLPPWYGQGKLYLYLSRTLAHVTYTDGL